MKHEPESLLRKTIKFDEDFKVNDTVTIPKGTVAYVTADINDILAILLYDAVEGLDDGWVTFKNMSWIRDKFSIVEEQE
jgi:hypothetical protein